eukprot:CAMPEP_0182602858 /NCGR_PEP_ID=MMETSP1324-20130603/92204_1 /TAXON_ID=236786 /ORGANISM="Florenciella sp., Strain RCC1587" /LENGTH=91 /DNA_ID=CAMNT_0024820785 /DNA_START=686 /DNA_END=960 /DNA_ORIENTATION=-
MVAYMLLLVPARTEWLRARQRLATDAEAGRGGAHARTHHPGLTSIVGAICASLLSLSLSEAGLAESGPRATSAAVVWTTRAAAEPDTVTPV